MSFLSIFKRKAKEPPPQGMVAFMMRNPVWTETSLENLAKVGYENCMTVFTCISKLTRAAGGIPWVLYKTPQSAGSKREELYTHKLLTLIGRPNPQQGQSRFIEGVTGFYYVSGNSYILEIGPERKDSPPREMYWLYPHQTQILSGNYIEPISGYEYTADPSNPKTYKPDEVLHLKNFHPTDHYYGLSPLKVAAQGIDTLNMATEWNMKLLQNEMRPSGAIKMEGHVSEEQRKVLKKSLKEDWSGHENAGRPLILEGAQEWMPFSINPKDADWLNSQKLTIRFVSLTLGIPPELVGDAENKTYSNQKEARKALYEETILPYMDFLRDEFNNWLTPKFGDRLYLDYDRDSIEALKEERQSIFDRAEKSTFLTINEKRLMTGFGEIPNGDVIYMPISMIPVGSSPKKEDEEKRFGFKSKNKSFWQAPERKEALWNNFVLRVKAKEKPFIPIAEQYMREQSKRIQKALKEIDTISGLEPEGIFDLEAEAKAYQKKFMSWYVDNLQKAGDAGISASKGGLYDLGSKVGPTEFEVTPELQEMLKKKILETGTQVSETVIEQIFFQLAEGQREAWTVEEFTQALLTQIDEFKPWKARLWARTESAKTENWGTHEGYKQAEFIEQEGWLSAFAPESRDAHMAADGQIVGLDQYFDIGGVRMQFPGDTSGGAGPGDICNCLCTTFPEVMELQGG